MVSNIPSPGPSAVPPPAPANPTVTPDMVPAWQAERASVIQNTKGSLGKLAEATLPLAASLGIVGIMAYGLKTMVKGEAPPLLK